MLVLTFATRVSPQRDLDISPSLLAACDTLRMNQSRREMEKVACKIGKGGSYKVGPYNRYKWSYNPYKWPYEWVTAVIITLLIGVIAPLRTGWGPPTTWRMSSKLAFFSRSSKCVLIMFYYVLLRTFAHSIANCIDPQSWGDEEIKTLFKLHIPETKP